MKHLLLTALLAFGLTGLVAASGTQNGAEGRDAEVKAKKAKAFVEVLPALAVPVDGRSAAVSRDFQQAADSQRGLRRSLFFSPDNARLLACIERVEPGTLSPRLTRKLRKKYKGYRIGQVIRYFDGDTLYFVYLKKDRQEVLVSCLFQTPGAGH